MWAATCGWSRNIAITETPSQLQARLELLKKQLVDPVTAADAAIRLEAIGDNQAKEILLKGIKTDDPEVRFYAAEALAYLDATEAVEPLVYVAREEPAFRVHALAALSAMDDGAAYDGLRSLLSVKSAETRYGAFRAMSAMAPSDSLLQGEDLDGKFKLHLLGYGRRSVDPRHEQPSSRDRVLWSRSRTETAVGLGRGTEHLGQRS